MSVVAIGSNTVDATIHAASISLGDLSGSVVDAEVLGSSGVAASYGSNLLLTSGDVVVSAASVNTVTAMTDMSSVALVGVGIALPTAQVAAPTTADFAGHQYGGTSLSVRGSSTNTVTATSGSIGFGVVQASFSSAQAIVTGDVNTQARILPGASVDAPSAAVVVDAHAANTARATGGAVSVGLATVNVANPQTTVNAQTHAVMQGAINGGSATAAGAKSLQVQATSVDVAITELANTSGGAITLSDTAAGATVATLVDTSVGVAGAPIAVLGDVTLAVSSQPLGSSSSRNTSVGALAISSNKATVSVSPTVALTIGTGTVLNAGGTITLQAFQNTQAPPVDNGVPFDGASGVDTTTNAITLSAPHNLDNGATITYLANGGTPVGGLTSGNHYNVFVIDPTHLQLGSTFDAANIDPVTDTISFGLKLLSIFMPVNHNLDEGQLVVYAAPDGGVTGLVSGRTYRVHVVDYYRIQLFDAGTPAAPVTVTGADITGGDTITQANSYQNGQSVTYTAPTAIGSFNSSVVDVAVDASGHPVPNDPVNPTGFVSQNNDAIVVQGAFHTGQAVVYRAAGAALGNLTNNQTYYVIVLPTGQIQLADSPCHATGCAATKTDPKIDVTALALSADISAAGLAVLHQLFAVGQQPIVGLNNGDRYFIVGADPSKFQLALTQGGAAIALDGSGITGVGSFTPAIVDLLPGSPGGSGQRLIIDLTAPGTGMQELGSVGAISPTTGGGSLSTATVSGDGGGFIASTTSRPTATANAVMTITVGGGAQITSGGDFRLITLSNAGVKADGSSDGVGFVSVGSAFGTASSSATTTVLLDTGSMVTTGGSIVIEPVTNTQAEAYSQSNAAGLGTGVGSESRVTLSNTSSTTLNGRMIAGNDLSAGATSQLNANSDNSASGTSFAGKSSANDCNNNDCHVVANNATTLTVGRAAYLQADNVTLHATVGTGSQLRENSQSSSDGAFEGSYARVFIGVTSTALVHLITGAKIVGYETVTITAEHTKLMIAANSHSHCGCFGGDSDAYTDVSYEAQSRVVSDPGVTIRTATLLVQALQNLLPHWNIDSTTATGFIDIGNGGSSNTVYHASRDILWEATVILHAPNPQLIVDVTGRIVKLYGVVVKDDLGVVYALGDTIAAGRIIEVQDIVNSGGGSIRFFADAPGGQDHVSSGPAASTLTGTQGSVRVQNTFDFVKLYNFSSRSMVVHRIAVANLANIGATVTIDVDVSNDFRFTIGPALFLPTLVDIDNFRVSGNGTASLTLDGYIDNPIGTTDVVDEHGDILAGPDGPVIRTNQLVIMANAGTIGQHGAGFRIPIPVILVQSDYVDGGVDPARYVLLIADARDDVVLDITYSLRAPTTSPFPGMAPVIGPIHAGHDIDLVIHDSLRGSDVPAVGSLGIRVINNSIPPFDGPDGQFQTFYWPDGTPVPYGDPVLIAWGTANTPTDSAYTFPDLSAGNDISVVHSSDATTISFDAVTNVDATLSSRQFPAEAYSTSDGDGEITLYTNGFVTDLETIDDLRVGTITSTRSDVILRTAEATASILDAGDIDDGTPRVAGRDITLLAGLVSGRIGGTGATPDFLEIQSSLSARGWVLAFAADDILLDQVRGTLYVSAAVSLFGDVALRTRFGSILSDAADGATRVVGFDIDLIAVGGSVGADSPDRSADLVIDTADAGRLYAVSMPGDVAGIRVEQGIFVTEADGPLSVLRAEAPEGDVRLTVPYHLGDESLFVLSAGTTIDGLTTVGQDGTETLDRGRIVAGGAVTLLVGQNVFAPADTLIQGASVTIRASFGQGVGAAGSVLYFGGEVTGHATQIFGGYGDDQFVFDGTLLGGHTLVYGGPGETASGHDGNDTFLVSHLQSMLGTHIAQPGDAFAGTPVRDSLVLYGQGGDNTFLVQTWGGQDPVGHDYRIIVRGGGARLGLNTLTVDGTDDGDLFLFRGITAIPEQPDAKRPAFVAQIDESMGTVERIDYDADLNGGLIVNGYGGDDRFVFDDNTVLTTVYGGDGADTFTVGQFFATPRVEPDVQPGDALRTVQTEFGWASPGISAPTVLYGGDGADTFILNTNRAELRAEAATGDDVFQLLATRLIDGTALRNGFVSLDGGVDAATLTVRTAGPASAIAVMEGLTDVEETIIRGAGLDADTFHLGRPAPVSAPFTPSAPIGLPGDALAPAAPIVIPAAANTPGTGVIIVTETDGSTRLISGVQETDSYTIALTDPPTARVYITISASYGGGIPYAQISVDGGLTWADRVILVFEAGQTAAKTVMVRLIAGAGPHEPVLRAFAAVASPLQGPGLVVETLGHVVTSDDPRYENAHVRNVYINLTAEHGGPVPPLGGGGGSPGGPGDGPGGGPGGGGGGTPAGSASAGHAAAHILPATGSGDMTGWLLGGILALLLGSLLVSGRRRRA